MAKLGLYKKIELPKEINNNQPGDLDDSIAECPIKTVFS